METKKEQLDRIIRVDHAGEYGARRIYEGQMSILKHSSSYETIKKMHQQEEKHLRYFEDQIQQRRVRPTVLLPLWHVGGYMLGAVTALIGEKAAMACTVAVEEVIGEHYESQAQELQNSHTESELCNTIQEFQEEELEHRDIGIDYQAQQAIGYKPITTVVKAITRLAIKLSQRF